MDATIGLVIGFFLGPLTDEQFLCWPPDVFAISAVLLRLTGGYRHVVNRWPPEVPSGEINPGESWNDWIKRVGSEWQESVENRDDVPNIIQNWWNEVLAQANMPLDELRSNTPLCHTLLHLVAAADEACYGVGTPDYPSQARRAKPRGLKWDAKILLQKQNREGKAATLCKRIPAALLAVLPKLHTPTMGATLRSLTHNLALHHNAEVEVRWHQVTTLLDHTVNILCLPWPLVIAPIAFSQSATKDVVLRNKQRETQFFDYTTPKAKEFVDQFRDVLRRAIASTGNIDGVVFPELAMDEDTFKLIRAVLDKEAPSCFLIAGISSVGKNEAFCSIPDASGIEVSGLLEVRQKQAKHHRWKLDRSQIGQYGLGGRLDVENVWWESVVVQPRTMNFFSLQPWLTMGVLICEDLARQDPIADLIRAVGPNLVVALLMDGPQLAGRWPARYATVLADDPGSSVLTLSSLGMVLLSKPFDKPASRVVGLWKDYKSPTAIEIDLPAGKTAAILSLTRHFEEEYSADGRSDGKSTAYLMLTALHTI